jgi:hypothetical protein
LTGVGRHGAEPQRASRDRLLTAALGTVFILVMVAWCSLLGYGTWWLVSRIVT